MPWRGPQEPGEFPTNGYNAIQWMEDSLLITDGPKIGQPVELYDEQALHLLNRYRIDPDATSDMGNDAYRNGGSQLIRGQKWGKDPLLAMIALFHAFGPCDFAGWDADGEPVGQPHPSPWGAVAALNDVQANNTWLPLKAMVETSYLVDLAGVEVTEGLIRLPSGNPLERLTTTAFGRLGGRFTHVTLTENGLMTATGTGANNGQRSPLSFARTLIRSVDGLNGMWVGASNTWDPTEHSHCQEVVEAKDPHVYVDAKISRGKVDLGDDAKLSSELRYLYGDTLTERGGHIALQRLMRSCRNKANGENEVRRFFLSEILAGELVLCAQERWAAMARDDDPLRPGEEITLGFDGSRSRDATVLTACRVRDGRIFHLRTWVPQCCCDSPDHPPMVCPDKRIDRVSVDQAISDTFVAYEVLYLYADPYRWQDYLDRWAARYPKRVVEVPTNVETRMDGMLERFQTAVAANEFTHDADPTLAAHVDNAAVAKGGRKPSKPRVGDDGLVILHYLKVVKKRDGVHIDGSISMLLALEARGQAVEDGALDREATKPVGTTRSESQTGAMPAGASIDIATVQW